MLTKFTVTFEHEAGLWFATSDELNCFIAKDSLDTILADMPNVVRMVEKRSVDQQKTESK